MKHFHVSLLGPRNFSCLLDFWKSCLFEHCANTALCTAHCLWYFVRKWRLATGLLLYLSILYLRSVATGPRRCQWPRGLRRGFAAARLLGFRVRIPSGERMSVSCDCCVLSGRGLCDGLITRPEESYRVWFVWVWSWSLDNEEALVQWGLLLSITIVMDSLTLVLQYNLAGYCLSDEGRG